MSNRNGYGYATDRMLNSLHNLGYEVNPNDSTADVEIWFDQPHHWKFSEGVYKIGYHPWESTILLPGWADIMNKCDEIWTPSPIIAEWYRTFAGITVPVYVYEHGVDPVWTPAERELGGTFKFLHVGGEAQRKGAKEAMQAMRLAFPRDVDVSLTMKIWSQGWNIGQLPRVNIVNKSLDINELVQMYHDHHVYVYPSYGEGFGLTPLQALATGMPTITLPAWCPYADYLDENLTVGSDFVRSPYPALHPGAMLKPKLDDVIDAMRYAYNNYEKVNTSAHDGIKRLTEHYDWDRLTKQAFVALEQRLESS